MTINQHEQNLIGFIDLIKSSMSDIGSFTKGDISSYFLMLRKFFEDYVNENNKIYDLESPLYIKNQEAENINHFFNVMIEIFEKSNSTGFIHEMTVVDRATLIKISECYRTEMVDIQMNLKKQFEIVATHNDKIEYFLKKLI
jgi:hypothetical protein